MLGKKGERMMPWQSYIFVPHDSGIFVCVCEMIVCFFPPFARSSARIRPPAGYTDAIALLEFVIITFA